MGFIKPGAGIRSISGKVGNAVYAEQQDGRVIMRSRPLRTAEFTEGEKKGQSRIRLGVLYVKAVLADLVARAGYEILARIKRKRACDLAMADFLGPPLVSDIDPANYKGHPGEPIRIKATDKVDVARVTVVIRDLAGTILEQGLANRDTKASDLWVYPATVLVAPNQTVRIEATAAELPGNMADKVIDHAL